MRPHTIIDSNKNLQGCSISSKLSFRCFGERIFKLNFFPPSSFQDETYALTDLGECSVMDTSGDKWTEKCSSVWLFVLRDRGGVLHPASSHTGRFDDFGGLIQSATGGRSKSGTSVMPWKKKNGWPFFRLHLRDKRNKEKEESSIRMINTVTGVHRLQHYSITWMRPFLFKSFFVPVNEASEKGAGKQVVWLIVTAHFKPTFILAVSRGGES